METRSQRLKREAVEYAELRRALIGMGMYEENMKLVEMNDILQALQMSESDFREKEDTFTNIYSPRTSTMIHDFMDSPTQSPKPDFEILTVQALVHHEMNWSPSSGSNVSRNKNENDVNDDYTTRVFRKRTLETLSAVEAKRFCFDSIESAPDSGVSLSNSPSTSPSPAWETVWEDGSFGTAPHSSTQHQSEAFCTIEDVSAIDPCMGSSVSDKEEENWD